MAWRELALLWAARERGALEALAARAGTPEAVAEAADIDPAGAEAAVEAAGAAAPIGVFLDALHGETANAELLDVEAVAAGECRVQEAGVVRSWLASAFGGAVPAGPLAAAVGRAID